MPSFLRFRSCLAVLLAVAFACLVAGGAAAASTWPPWPQTPLDGGQLSASARAAGKHGVPLNVVRGVTTYKDGPASSTHDFDVEAARLAWWYKQLYPRYGGSALVNWTRAAAAEMGPSASAMDVARATSFQQAAINTVLTAPFWVSVTALLPGAEAIGAAAPGEVGLGGAAASPAPAAGAGAGSAAAGKAGQDLANGGGAGEPPADTAAGATRSPVMATLAAAAALFIANDISRGTKPALIGGWFQPLYQGVVNYAWVLAVLAIAFGGLYVVVAGAAGKETGVMAMLAGVPYAVVMMLAVPALAMAALAIVDSLCAGLMQQFPEGARMLHLLAVMLGAISAVSLIAGHFGHATVAHFAGGTAWWVSLGALLAAGAVALELIAREVAIYLTVLMIPLALIGGLFSPFAGWANALAKLLFAVIVAKLILAVGLVLAGTMVMAGVTELSPYLVLVGIVTLMLMTLTPTIVHSAMLHVGQPWHSRVSSVVGGASYVARQNPLARQVRDGSRRVHEAHSHPRRPEPSDHPQRPLADRPSRRPSYTRQGSPTGSGGWRSSTESFREGP